MIDYLKNQNNSKVNVKKSCANCGNTYEGNYCYTCGQKSGLTRLNMKELFSIIPSTVLLFEKRYWSTTRDFFKNPLKMIKDYSEGKRKYYASPLQFYYFFTSISLIIYALIPLNEDTNSAETEDSLRSDPIISGALDSPLGERILYSVEYFESFYDNYYNFFELGFPLVTGLLVFLFYRKIMNLAECFAFAFLLMAFSIEVSSIIKIPFRNTNFGDLIEYTFIAVPVVLIFYRLGKQKFLNIFIGFLIYLSSSLIYVFGIFFVIFLLYPILK